MIDEMGGDFLQWLRGFYFVAKNKSVTQACREVRRNQPTISHQIKCLEKEFGLTLFDRSRGKMELTPEGQVFLEKAISVFEVIKDMKSTGSEDPALLKGHIVIATTHAVIHYFLPKYVLMFREQYPHIHFDMEGGGLKILLDQIESASADFGIANLKHVPDTLTYHQLFGTTPVLITKKNNPFFRKKAPSLIKIAEAPFILFPRSSTITPLIENTFARHDLDLNIVLTLNNFEDVKKYVSMGVGVSILDDYTITEEDRNRLDVFALNRYFKKRQYGLIIRKKKYIAPHVKAFIWAIKPDIPLA